METAVITMSKIELDHPGTPEADLAGERLSLILSHLAQVIASDAMTLSEAVSTYRGVEPYLGRHSERVLAAAALAERYEEDGLSIAAKAEYAAIWESLLPSDRREIPPELLDKLTLLQSQRYLRQGNPVGALNLIAERPRAQGGRARFGICEN